MVPAGAGAACQGRTAPPKGDASLVCVDRVSRWRGAPVSAVPAGRADAQGHRIASTPDRLLLWRLVPQFVSCRYLAGRIRRPAREARPTLPCVGGGSGLEHWGAMPPSTVESAGRDRLGGFCVFPAHWHMRVYVAAWGHAVVWRTNTSVQPLGGGIVGGSCTAYRRCTLGTACVGRAIRNATQNVGWRHHPRRSAGTQARRMMREPSGCRGCAWNRGVNGADGVGCDWIHPA